MISWPLKLKAWTTGLTTAPVVSRSVSPTTTDGAARLSNTMERTDVELPLTSAQPIAPRPIMQTHENDAPAADDLFIPTGQRVAWRGSRKLGPPHPRDSCRRPADRRR